MWNVDVTLFVFDHCSLPYIFLHFDVASPQQQVFCTYILNTFEIMYLYLYFNYFFGCVLVLVLKILLKSVLPITESWYSNEIKVGCMRKCSAPGR